MQDEACTVKSNSSGPLDVAGSLHGSQEVQGKDQKPSHHDQPPRQMPQQTLDLESSPHAERAHEQDRKVALLKIVDLLRRIGCYMWSHGEFASFLAAFAHAVAALTAKLLMREQVPTFEIIGASGVVSIVVWALVASFAGQMKLFSDIHHIPFLFGRGLFGSAGKGLYYFSLEYLNPALVSIIGWLLLRERMGWRGILGVVTSIGGVLLQSQPPFLFRNKGEGEGEWDASRTTGTAFALASALGAALAFIMIRYLKESETALVITVWYHTFAIIIAGPLLGASTPAPPVLPSTSGWLLLLLSGASLFIAHLLLDRSFQLLTASRASVISLVQVIFSWIFGLAFLGETTNVVGGMGTVLILFGVVLVAIRHVDLCPHTQEGEDACCGMTRFWRS